MLPTPISGREGHLPAALRRPQDGGQLFWSQDASDIIASGPLLVTASEVLRETMKTNLLILIPGSENIRLSPERPIQTARGHSATSLDPHGLWDQGPPGASGQPFIPNTPSPGLSVSQGSSNQRGSEAALVLSSFSQIVGEVAGGL